MNWHSHCPTQGSPFERKSDLNDQKKKPSAPERTESEKERESAPKEPEPVVAPEKHLPRPTRR